MEQSIKNVEAVLNLCISRGAFKTLAEAQQAIGMLQQLQTDYKEMAQYLQQSLDDKEISTKQPNPIPKQSKLNPVAQEKEK